MEATRRRANCHRVRGVQIELGVIARAGRRSDVPISTGTPNVIGAPRPDDVRRLGKWTGSGQKERSHVEELASGETGVGVISQTLDFNVIGAGGQGRGQRLAENSRRCGTYDGAAGIHDRQDRAQLRARVRDTRRNRRRPRIFRERHAARAAESKRPEIGRVIGCPDGIWIGCADGDNDPLGGS